MAKTRSSVRKREREIEKRQRELRKAQKAADKRERRIKRDRPVVSAPSEATEVGVARNEPGHEDGMDSEEPGAAEQRTTC
jgi:hypothetical protein